MIESLLNYLRRRRENKLYNQWAVHDGVKLRDDSREKPMEFKGELYNQWIQEGSLSPEDIPQEVPTTPEMKAPRHEDTDLLRQLMRLVVVEAGIITTLLVALAIVLTLLITR